MSHARARRHRPGRGRGEARQAGGGVRACVHAVSGREWERFYLTPITGIYFHNSQLAAHKSFRPMACAHRFVGE
jgi:hypothetical protein